MVSPASRREVMLQIQQTRELPERRLCRALGFSRSSQRYQSAKEDKALRTRLRELAVQRHRFGYRRLHILLKREGWALNHKKLYRIYREEGLSVKKRKGRKRAVGTRTALPSATYSNHM